MICVKFGTIAMANNDLAKGGRDLWITLYIAINICFQLPHEHPWRKAINHPSDFRQHPPSSISAYHNKASQRIEDLTEDVDDNHNYGQSTLYEWKRNQPDFTAPCDVTRALFPKYLMSACLEYYLKYPKRTP